MTPLLSSFVVVDHALNAAVGVWGRARMNAGVLDHACGFLFRRDGRQIQLATVALGARLFGIGLIGASLGWL